MHRRRRERRLAPAARAGLLQLPRAQRRRRHVRDGSELRRGGGNFGAAPGAPAAAAGQRARRPRLPALRAGLLAQLPGVREDLGQAGSRLRRQTRLVALPTSRRRACAPLRQVMITRADVSPLQAWAHARHRGWGAPRDGGVPSARRVPLCHHSLLRVSKRPPSHMGLLTRRNLPQVQSHRSRRRSACATRAPRAVQGRGPSR